MKQEPKKDVVDAAIQAVLILACCGINGTVCGIVVGLWLERGLAALASFPLAVLAAVSGALIHRFLSKGAARPPEDEGEDEHWLEEPDWRGERQ